MNNVQGWFKAFKSKKFQLICYYKHILPKKVALRSSVFIDAYFLQTRLAKGFIAEILHCKLDRFCQLVLIQPRFDYVVQQILHVTNRKIDHSSELICITKCIQCRLLGCHYICGLI